MLQNHFFANFRKLQKKLPICKKKFTKILHIARAVVIVVKNVKKRRSEKNLHVVPSFVSQTVTQQVNALSFLLRVETCKFVRRKVRMYFLLIKTSVSLLQKLLKVKARKEKSDRKLLTKNCRRNRTD